MQIHEVHEFFQLQARANGRSPNTRDQYARHIRMLESWLVATDRSTDICHIDHIAVAEFLCSAAVREKRGGGARKATSANGLRSSLRCFFAWARDAGYATRSAAALVQRARCGPPPPRCLSADDQARLLKTLRADDGGRDHALIHTLLATGLRIGSALALCVEDLDLARGEAVVRTAKGDRPTVVVLGREIAEHLGRFIGDRSRGLLFGGITARHANRIIKSWCARAGIRTTVSPHMLRHSFGMRIYQATGDLLLTQAALGHASIASTTVYARCDRERLRAVLGA